MDTPCMIMLLVLGFIALLVSGIFAFFLGRLQTSITSLGEAIGDLKTRDESVNVSISAIEKMQAVAKVYQKTIDKQADKVEKQGQYIGKLLERTRIHGTMIDGIAKALKDNDIHIQNNYPGASGQQIGDNKGEVTSG